jgi:phospholipid transport system transporter-binding protein
MNSSDDTASPAAGAKPVAGQIVLGAACTIHEAQALRAHLLEQATRSGPYEIDGGGVEQIDTAGLQLVLAFALDCLERNVHYTWKARSPVLEEAIQVLGVAALLESPGAASYIPGGAA